MQVRELLRWTAIAGAIHAVAFVIMINLPLGELAYFLPPLVHIAGLGKMHSDAMKGRDYQERKGDVVTATRFLLFLPVGYFWCIRPVFFFGVLAVFMAVSIWTLWQITKARQECQAVWDVSTFGQVCSLTAALFAATTVPAMMGSFTDSDSYSLLAIFGTLVLFVTLSAGSLLIGSDVRRLWADTKLRFSTK